MLQRPVQQARRMHLADRHRPQQTGTIDADGERYPDARTYPSCRVATGVAWL
ncbi:MULTISPECIES: hypothetical protein [Xanthomonas translucens group]|uniref:hypothetical protein n=1 Tax=Xanthomonas translucens group TaxID=3390202 RepID=UPI0012D8018C|nr:hypothetical protein [Xanthomonas translucens]